MVLHQLNALSDQYKSQIPRSNLYRWKGKDLSQMMGVHAISASDRSVLEMQVKHQKLMRATRAVCWLFMTLSDLFKSAANKAKILRANKTMLIAVLKRVNPVLGSQRVYKALGLSASQLYYWLEKKKCQQSIFQVCQSRHPFQLLSSEVAQIKAYLQDEKYKHWSVLSIYYQALRDKAVSMGIGTWYKYANRLGINRKFFKLNRRHPTGIRADKPLQTLHMDVTIFRPMDHIKIYIYFVVDNFSRTILSWQASHSYSSQIAMTVLKGAIEKHSLGSETTLITDGGPENHGEVTAYVSKSTRIKHQIAQKDIVQSNSMVESVNKHLKYYYLFKKELQNLAETIAYLNESVTAYNTKPHGKLYGLTPDEVLNGTIPAKDHYKTQIATARKERTALNRVNTCCGLES